MKNSIVARIFIFLLLITGISATYYFWPANKITNNNEQITIQTDDGQYPTPDPSPKRGGTNDVITTNTTQSNAANNGIAEQLNNTITSSAAINQLQQLEQAQRYSVAIVAGDKTYPLSVAQSTTVYDAMRQLTVDSRQPFLFSAKEYSGMGYFVEEINGVKNSAKNNTYWFMYINGQSATVGASAYILKPNDIIAWKYEKVKF